MIIFALIYLVIIANAEALLLLYGLIPGILIYAALLPILLIQYALSVRTIQQRLLPTLALIPILRILSLLATIPRLPAVYSNLTVGLAMLVTIGFVVRLLHLSRTDLGLTRHAWLFQLGVGIIGLPMGWLTYQLAGSAVDTSLYRPVGFVMLAIFAGAVEELLFRGLIQPASEQIYGRFGVLYSTALYVLMSLGTRSVAYVALIGVSGLIAGWCTQRTRSILGAVVLRTLFIIGFLIVGPLISFHL